MTLTPVPHAPASPASPHGNRARSFLTVPATAAYRIINARVPVDLAPALQDTGDADRLTPCEIVVDGTKVSMFGAPGSFPVAADLPTVDLSDGIVLPRFVDVHTHLDKGHIWPRAANPDGTPDGARGAVMADRETRWVADDVRERMDFSLRCAYAHGTAAIRTHLDSLGRQAAISFPVFAEMREAWKGRIALQASALFPADIAIDDEPQFRALADIVERHGGIMGGVTYMGEKLSPKIDAVLDKLFEMAAARGLELDLHVDESCAPDAVSLERIADAALRHKFKGRVLCGHCCSLALASEEDFKRIAGKLAEADVAIVSLPMVNMYLQDRKAMRTPRLRGVAPLHELDTAGVRVMVSSDNTRDPFHAYGDLDMMEVFREATRILHFDHSDRPWARMFGAASAEHMGLPKLCRITAGELADLVLTRARSFQELMSRPQSDRVVLVNGKQIDTTLPDYRELDHLYAKPVLEAGRAATA